MIEIPEDILHVADDVWFESHDLIPVDAVIVIARAILAERERSRTALSEADQRMKDAKREALEEAAGYHEELSYRLRGSPRQEAHRRFLTICGFGCMAFSPDITREGFILPDRLWAIILAMLLLFGAGIWVGTRVESKEIGYLIGTPVCPKGMDIIGTSRKTYHLPESRYRALIVPRKCFRTETEAKAAGYAMVK